MRFTYLLGGVKGQTASAQELKHQLMLFSDLWIIPVSVMELILPGWNLHHVGILHSHFLNLQFHNFIPLRTRAPKGLCGQSRHLWEQITESLTLQDQASLPQCSQNQCNKTNISEISITLTLVRSLVTFVFKLWHFKGVWGCLWRTVGL